MRTEYELESKFQRDCNLYLDSLIEKGILIDYIHLPKLVNSYGKGRMGRNKNRKGKPDLYVILAEGKVIMIELKIKNNVIDKDQESYLKKYKKMGYQTYIINGDFEEFKMIIEKNMNKNEI